MPKIIYAKVYKERLLSAALKELKKNCVTAKAFVKILRATGQTSLLFDNGTLAMNFDELSAIGFFGPHGSDPFFESYQFCGDDDATDGREV
ncbi:hypothetical protein [Candidatus Sodalis pierantonius]|uniref:hypothetical protein n=1 Tax=Candidatus Sodalis pierantonii TaxID=1486991 RepID=UPI00046D4F2E|nr:hypothetical protein [Candidatus Sodalis pierantonius]